MRTRLLAIFLVAVVFVGGAAVYWLLFPEKRLAYVGVSGSYVEEGTRFQEAWVYEVDLETGELIRHEDWVHHMEQPLALSWDRIENRLYVGGLTPYGQEEVYVDVVNLADSQWERKIWVAEDGQILFLFKAPAQNWLYVSNPIYRGEEDPMGFLIDVHSGEKLKGITALGYSSHHSYIPGNNIEDHFGYLAAAGGRGKIQAKYKFSLEHDTYVIRKTLEDPEKLKNLHPPGLEVSGPYVRRQHRTLTFEFYDRDTTELIRTIDLEEELPGILGTPDHIPVVSSDGRFSVIRVTRRWEVEGQEIHRMGLVVIDLKTLQIKHWIPFEENVNESTNVEIY